MSDGSGKPEITPTPSREEIVEQQETVQEDVTNLPYSNPATASPSKVDLAESSQCSSQNNIYNEIVVEVVSREQQNGTYNNHQHVGPHGSQSQSSQYSSEMDLVQIHAQSMVSSAISSGMHGVQLDPNSSFVRSRIGLESLDDNEESIDETEEGLSDSSSIGNDKTGLSTSVLSDEETTTHNTTQAESTRAEEEKEIPKNKNSNAQAGDVKNVSSEMSVINRGVNECLRVKFAQLQ